MTTTSTAAPGWYTDPNRQDQLRWWTGVGWTEHTSPLAVRQPVPAQPASGRRVGKMVTGIVLTAVGAVVAPLALLAMLVYASEGQLAYGFGRAIIPLSILIVGIVLWATSGPRPASAQQGH